MLLWLLVTANVVPSLPILVTLMMQSIQTLVLTTATPCNIPKDGILQIKYTTTSTGLNNCYINHVVIPLVLKI
jgi:hypothetical protein